MKPDVYHKRLFMFLNANNTTRYVRTDFGALFAGRVEGKPFASCFADWDLLKGNGDSVWHC
jgi:hypothetical protein